MSTPSIQRVLVTGATGSLGRSVVRQLIDRQLPIRALVRPGGSGKTVANQRTDTIADVETFAGDLSDPQSLSGITEGISHVIHCAARLGDWGPWQTFESGIVKTTEHLIDRCLDSSIIRFVHVGSVASYGHIRSPRPWTESQPLGQNLWWWDHYARAKMLAEGQANRLGQTATIVRPTWIYGPNDQVILPRIISTLRQGKVTLLGPGDNLLNMVHADDVSAAIIEACVRSSAGGKTFNLCSDGEITQRDFFHLVADTVGCPRVAKSVPKWLAHQFGFLGECIGHARGSERPPRVTRHGISLLTRPTCFSSNAARDVLDWKTRQPIRESLVTAIESILTNQAN